MKTRIAILIVLLLTLVCTVASAQEYYTLPEIREQAAQGWHETYTDKYGRNITVDIEIDVFGEKCAPVLQVSWPNPEKYKESRNDPYESLVNAKKEKDGKTTYVYESYNGARIEMDRAYGEEYGNSLTPREAFAFFADHVTKQGFCGEGYLYEHPQTFNVLCSIKEKKIV